MYNRHLEIAKYAAKEAQKLILEVYKSNFEVITKDDASPVTKADILADAKIKEIIKTNFPTHAFLTEESEDNLSRLNNDCVWIIDPLDGTKDFVEKTGEFTINIAFVYRHQPVVGVILIPVMNKMYFAVKNEGSYVLDLSTQEQKRIYTSTRLTGLTALISRFHVAKGDLDYLDKHKNRIKEIKNVGSSIKACLIAQGEGDLQCKTTTGTKEWDIAASYIIIKEAGGSFTKPNGEVITFNRKNVVNEEGFIIMNRIDSNLLIR